MAVQIPPYVPTPLVQRIDNAIQGKSPFAFAVANFGEGPVLTYKGNLCPVDILMVNLTLGNHHIRFSHQSQPPYFIALAQDGPTQPIAAIIYGADAAPMLSCEGDLKLKGQAFAYGKGVNGERQVIAHALFLPELSHVYANTTRPGSLLVEGDAKLCDHLLLCAVTLDPVLDRMGDTKESST